MRSDGNETAAILGLNMDLPSLVSSRLLAARQIDVPHVVTIGFCGHQTSGVAGDIIINHDGRKSMSYFVSP